jgi:hypothetical protein
MALPKKNKTDIQIKSIDPDGGPRNWVDQFLDQNKQFLPRNVDLTDLDQGFVDFIDKDLRPSIGYLDMPAHFFGIQRWSEFANSWQDTDKYKNIKIPFIFINRENNPEIGTNPADYKIPVRKNFPYAKIPVWDGNRKGGDVYTIPNPVGVDMLYTIKFFTFKMGELNEIYKNVSELFASAQAYVNVKGHYFPILLESVSDESKVEDLDGKRYYVQTYEMRLQGYIVDSEEFEVKPMVNRILVTTELMSKKPRAIINRVCDVINDERIIKLFIHFLPGAYTEIYFNSEDDINVISIDVENISSYTFKVNGSDLIPPFTIKKDDSIFLSIIKTVSTEFSEIKLNGNII